MSAPESVTRQVEEGLVLGEQGRWVHIAEQLIHEKRIMHQLLNGNVQLDGKWVAIGEARRRAAPAAAKPPTLKAAMDAAAREPGQPVASHIHHAQAITAPQTEDTSFEAVENMLETVCIDMSQPSSESGGTAP